MPIYEYEREDGTVFEVVQKITDEPLSKCPETGRPVRRLVSASAFHLKGSGWYKTDYSANGSSNGSSSKESSASGDSAAGSGESSSSDSGSTKSESKSESKSSESKSCGSSCGCH